MESICAQPRCLRRFDGPPERCPHCGGKGTTMRSMRIRGWVGIGCGIFLIAMMAGISWFAAPMMLDPGVDHGNGRFEGGKTLGIAILGLFGLIALFGVVAIRMGVGMIRTGRIDMHLRSLLIGMAGVFMAIGMAAEFADEFL